MTQPDVEVIDLEPTPVVVIDRSIPRRRLGDTIARGIQRVRTSVSAAGVATSGAPFVRYLDVSDDRLEIEIGLPLIEPNGIPGLRSSMLPGGTAAALWHVGPYDGLADAFSRLEAWVDQHAKSSGSPWESYVTEHDAEPPRTRIVWPVEPE